MAERDALSRHGFFAQRARMFQSDPLNPTLDHLLRLCRLDRTWTRAKGVWLEDSLGRRFLDCYAQFGAVSLGHNADRVNDAVRSALESNEPAMVQPYRAFHAVSLAEELQRTAPGNFTCCVFTTSGAQAVEAAIKLVRSRTGRPLIVSAEGSFHGKTLGALAATGQTQYAEGFGPLPPDFMHVPFGSLDAMAERLRAEEGRVAGVLLEPIQGERGVIVPPPGYLAGVRELCSRHRVPLILDEIQTGLGRTGRLYACEHEEVEPDILLIAKGLGGGLFPLGACLVSAEYWDDRFALRHSSTFANNNIACRVGRVVLDSLTRGGICRAVAQHGEYLCGRLEQLPHKFPRIIAAARCRGLLAAIELRVPSVDEGYFMSFLAHQNLYAYAVAATVAENASVLILPTLGETPVLRIAPPLVINRTELAQALDGIEAVCAQLSQNRADTIARALGAANGTPVRAQSTEYEPVRLPPPTIKCRQPGSYAFLIHYTRPEDIPLTNPPLAHWSRNELHRFCGYLAALPPGVVMEAPPVRSITGQTANGLLLAVPLLPQEMARRGMKAVSCEIARAIDLANALGIHVVGLGAYTTPYSRRGRAVIGRGPVITTGSALTAGMTFVTTRCLSWQRGLHLTDARVAVVGAGGSVGRLCARLFARAGVHKMLLIGNPKTGAASLHRLCEQLEMPAGSVVVSTDLGLLEQCDIIISASGAIAPVLADAPIRAGTLISDVARPPDTSPSLRQRHDVLVIEGGLVALPDARLRFGAGNILGLPDGIQLACLAETILLALAGETRDRGIGDNVSLEEVDYMMQLARQHGFRPALLTNKAKPHLHRLLEVSRNGHHQSISHPGIIPVGKG
jgi:acetylornithine/succinyldiaminopimelate/putrescine aminotransferase/predicted amino acid dehydrogenase